MLILVEIGGTPWPAHVQMEAFHCSTRACEGLPVFDTCIELGARHLIQQLLFFSASGSQEIFLGSCSLLLGFCMHRTTSHFFILDPCTVLTLVYRTEGKISQISFILFLPCLLALDWVYSTGHINKLKAAYCRYYSTVNILLTHPPSLPYPRQTLLSSPFVLSFSFFHSFFHYLFLVKK